MCLILNGGEMKKSSIVLSVLAITAFVGCSHTKQVSSGGDSKISKYNFAPFDYIKSKSDGRFPAQAGISGLVKLVDELPNGAEKTLEWVNKQGKAELGLTRSVTKLEDLSPSQRVVVMEEFARAGSSLAKMFSDVPNLAEKATGYMKQMESVVQDSKMFKPGSSVVSGYDYPRTGFSASTDYAIYSVKKVNPALAKETETFAKELKQISGSRPVVKNTASSWIHSQAIVIKNTGKPLLSGKICNNGTIAFSDNVIAPITDAVVGSAEEITALKLVKEDEMAGAAVRNTKKSVKGSSCLRALQSVKGTSEPNGACPLWSAGVNRGVANVAQNLAVYCED